MRRTYIQPATSTAENGELKSELRRFWDNQQTYWEMLVSEQTTTARNRERAVSFVPDGSTVLDLACGNCANAALLKDRCVYFGVDISAEGLRRASGQHVQIVCGDVEQLPFRDGAFDVALATFALEHAIAPIRMLEELSRVVRRGGRAVILGPAWDFPHWYPPSIQKRAADKRWRLKYTLGRLQHQFAGWCFGRLPFQTIDRPDAFDLDFQPDTDAVYIVWTYEVIRFMKRSGWKLSHWEVDDRLLGAVAPVRWAKRLLTLLPPYRRAGSTALLVFQR